MEEKKLNELGQLPDWDIGRKWLVENYENYYTRRVTALEIWARNIKSAEINTKLWQSIIRVISLIKYRKPVIEITTYPEIINKIDYYEKNSKIPTREVLLTFCDFLDEALYKLKVVYDEETERPYVKAYYRGKQF